MIVTVTLNASVDRMYQVANFCPNTVMRVGRVVASPGGKGLNVARVAKLLGAQVTATGLLGGYTGDYIAQELAKDGVVCDFAPINSPSRCCINAIDQTTGKSTELLEPGPVVTPEELSGFDRIYEKLLSKAKVVVLSGSVPQGVDISTYGRLIGAAGARGVPVILDASGPLLAKGLEATPWLAKPNRDELEALVGKKELSLEELKEAATLLHHNGTQVVVVSLGAQGALMICREGAYLAQGPSLAAANTVGCGDSMVAGFAVARSRGLSMEEALRQGMAAATANAMNPRTGYFEQEHYEYAQANIQIKRI